MKYTYLGRSGLSVSRLCLGTMNFGAQTEEFVAHSIMDYAQASGTNFFETAHVYGGAEHRMTNRPNEGKLSTLIGGLQYEDYAW